MGKDRPDAEEIDLTSEDDMILDAVWDELGKRWRAEEAAATKQPHAPQSSPDEQ